MFWYILCIPFAALLRLFYNLTGSYGVSLILFTLAIKLILLPFQMKSKKSMVRMSRMSGKMQEIQKKYANNQAKMNEEMQKFYAEEGVNPMSGCLWSFLPLPILMALYYIVREPIVYFMNFGGMEAGKTVLASAKEVVSSLGLTWTTMKNGVDGAYSQIEIVKHIAVNSDKPAVQQFLADNPNWINVDYNFLGLDLTSMPKDMVSLLSNGLTWAVIGVILIPILAGAFQLLMTKVTMKQQPQQGNSAGSMKTMMYMMPLMSVYFAFIMPAALGVYWIAQSVFSMIQELILGKFYNEKLEAEETARVEARDADRKRRMEEGRQQQEQQRQQAVQKQSLRDKQKAAQAAKAAKAKKAAVSTTEAGRVGERPYARGRSYKEDRYDSEN